MLDWLIVGGGIHGALLARVLVEEAGVALDRLRVLDPHPEPLARFRQCAAATGLDYLRSSVVHHLDGDPMSLRRFAERQGRRDELHGIYQRPSIGLFDAHCDAVTDRLGLRAVWVRGEALEIGHAEGGGLRVETTAGDLVARRVVLAVGSADQPLWPSWAEELRGAGAPIRHVFEPGFRIEEALTLARPVVLGGGLSAFQLALRLAGRRPGAVTLLARHEVRVHEFDADSRWMGPLGWREFARLDGGGERRGVIARERRRGSVPAEIAHQVERAVCDGAMRRLRDEVVGAAVASGEVEVVLGSGDRVRGDGVLLATGFHPRRPGGGLLDGTIGRLGLECAACGYPVVDSNLRWGPGLYVTGPLAELEIGPVARNILGARLAGERLAAVARGR
ncbi:MAG TPA: FAD/NAD(P)-binding protein [Thermoanaerobaculia bacterium]|nr:FAD/NAD(P)-binding protein [Thermoanaerobaculia bacterium]